MGRLRDGLHGTGGMDERGKRPERRGKRPERGPNAGKSGPNGGENSLRKKRKKFRFFPQKTLAFFSPMCYYNQASSEA